MTETWPPRLADWEMVRVERVLQSGEYTTGRYTEQVETQMRKLVGVEHCVAISSCTAAIHAALIAVGVNSEARVLGPDFTFVGTWSGVAHIGAGMVFEDVRRDDLTVSTENIAEAAKEKLRVADAILAVDLHGAPHRVPRDFVQQVPVVTDSCQALGTLGPDGRHLGAGGGIHCWSFGAAKSVGAPGGGAVTCNDEGVATRVRMLRDYGTVPVGERGEREVVDALGYNWRPSEVDMAIASGRLEQDRFRRIYARGEFLRSKLAKAGLDVQDPLPGSMVCWHKVRFGGPDRYDLERKLIEAEIPTHRWGRPLHEMPAFAASRPSGWPQSKRAAAMVCLGSETEPVWVWDDDRMEAAEELIAGG